MLVPHQAGQDRLSRMAIQELREIVAGKVVATVADAPVAAPTDPAPQADLVDEDPSDEGNFPF